MEPSKQLYETQYKLGGGSFSEVFVVRRRSDWKPFILKIQPYDNTERIEAEVKILEKLKHPNIIHFYDFWKEAGNSYILLEYATRGTLRDLLDSRLLPLVEKDALHLFAQIALGVRYIHSNNIIHRDLKPENIMLTGRSGDIVKIGDFGLSKAINDTNSGHAGSYNYMAPEIFKNLPAHEGVDVWSMGVILYEMITKQLPFSAESLAELVEKVCKEKPAPLKFGTSRALVSLVSKLLRKNTLHRANMYQIMLCPYLIRPIILISLNLGRGDNTWKKNTEQFSKELFESHLDSAFVDDIYNST